MNQENGKKNMIVMLDDRISGFGNSNTGRLNAAWKR